MESWMNDSETSICRLNALPDDLLVHVLSFLVTIDAIKTSSLSRRWRHLWYSIPSLDFDYRLFPHSAYPSAIRRRCFAACIDRTLHLRHPRFTLEKFRLRFEFVDWNHSSLIDSWILYAINHGVINLQIEFFFCTKEIHLLFDFPFYALRNGKVRDLKLVECHLSFPTPLSNVEFISLRSLFLYEVELTDKVISNLIVGCPNLESLSLHMCHEMNDIKIKGLKIKKLSLTDFHEARGSVEIDCPNLHSLHFELFHVGRYLLKNSSALVEATLLFSDEWDYCLWSKVVSLFGHVKKLTLQNWWFKLRAPRNVFSGNVYFHHLTWLELETGYKRCQLLSMAALLEASPNLDTLILDDLSVTSSDESDSEEESDYENLINSPIILSVPSLLQVTMKAYGETKNQLLLLKLIEKQGKEAVLKKIIVVPEKNGEVLHPPQVYWPREPKVQEPSPQSGGH